MPIAMPTMRSSLMGRIEDAITELLGHPRVTPPHPAERTDVLAEHDHGVVASQLGAQGFADRRART
jgi:hypothetical protein